MLSSNKKLKVNSKLLTTGSRASEKHSFKHYLRSNSAKFSKETTTPSTPDECWKNFETATLAAGPKETTAGEALGLGPIGAKSDIKVL